MAIAKAVTEKGIWDEVVVELPVANSDERKRICDFLEREAYAFVKNKYGRDKIVCDVQEKTLLFALKEIEEKDQQQNERRDVNSLWGKEQTDYL